MSTTVGFVGLGAMGFPMAVNLVRRQFRVRGFDMRREACEALAAEGGTAATSAADAAKGAEVLVLMVVNAAQAESVLFDAGACEAMAEGGRIVLMATCPPSVVAALAKRVAATGRVLIDAPVSGGVVGATKATLTIMVGTPTAVLETVKPVLDALGDKVFHVGQEPGQGAAVKTVNQLLCGVHIAAAAEGLVLAEKAGVDPALALKILQGSAAGSWMLNDRGPRMLEDEPRVTSAVDIFVKDLGIVLDAGRAGKVATPLAALAHQMFLSASAQGLGTQDDSQVIEAYRSLAGLMGE
ncbi:NAD(P)-dependent oxidoreductase [uncultured Alsobacter sp.]|uniref:NAD(P)-dependent oxidoreductase n=1 Tax=uncultured Alsobacter sp. TaxID=1748258 RepID=UPI0025F3974C|nr:NAD(P)-dependent oxidoreductase [uncultured Alsobacter sp.]